MNYLNFEKMMIWKDLFYFSRGERRALIVLVCLIVAATGLLLVSKNTSGTNMSKESLEAAYDTFARELLLPEDNKMKKSSVNRHDSVRLSASLKVASNKKNLSSSPHISARKKNYSDKYVPGTIIELNTADTFSLKKVPGIGSVFARRIVKFRNLLGGYASVTQLREVYGIDEERYNALSSWFKVDSLLIRKLKINELPADSLRRHPYLNYPQVKALERLRQQKGKLTGWENIILLKEFSERDCARLVSYLSFE